MQAVAARNAGSLVLDLDGQVAGYQKDILTMPNLKMSLALRDCFRPKTQHMIINELYTEVLVSLLNYL